MCSVSRFPLNSFKNTLPVVGAEVCCGGKALLLVGELLPACDNPSQIRLGGLWSPVSAASPLIPSAAGACTTGGYWHNDRPGAGSGTASLTLLQPLHYTVLPFSTESHSMAALFVHFHLTSLSLVSYAVRRLPRRCGRNSWVLGGSGFCTLLLVVGFGWSWAWIWGSPLRLLEKYLEYIPVPRWWATPCGVEKERAAL